MFSGPHLAALLTVSVVGNVYLFVRVLGCKRSRRAGRALRALLREGVVTPGDVNEAVEAERAAREGERETYRMVRDK